jgi:ribosomal protein L21
MMLYDHQSDTIKARDTHSTMQRNVNMHKERHRRAHVRDKGHRIQIYIEMG